jgi:hypothetical protein
MAEWETSMGYPEFQDAAKKVCEDYEGTVTLTERMRGLTKEQECKVAGLLVRQKQEYDDFINDLVESSQREELIQKARTAAQRAVCEPCPERQTEREAAGGDWRSWWIASVMIGAILLFLRLRF